MSYLGLTIHPYALFIAYIWHNIQLFSSFRVHVLLAQSVQVKEVFLTEVVRVVSEFVAVSPAPAIPQLIRMELISKALQLFHPSAVSWLLQSVKIYVRLKFFHVEIEVAIINILSYQMSRSDLISKRSPYLTQTEMVIVKQNMFRYANNSFQTEEYFCIDINRYLYF